MVAHPSDLPDLDAVQYVDSPDDRLPARVVGDWSSDKHYYLGAYINIFANGMHKKWPSRAYIDLFSGPGICMLREERKITEGSPLLALRTDHPFTEYFFSDLDSVAVDALRKRCEPFTGKPGIKINIFQKDCNVAAAEIAAMIKPTTLCLAFIDPTGLDFKFSTIQTLTQGKNMDLILHFSHGETIKRNIDRFYTKDPSKMDEFFDGTEWRAIYESNRANLAALTDGLLKLYKSKLARIGYTMDPHEAVLVKNSKNVPMYSLLFASKHPMGNKFWKKIKQIESNDQRSLF